MPTPHLHSVQASSVVALSRPSGDFQTALCKQPVAGRIWLGPRGLEGDECADLRYHGHEDQAICVYPMEHYPAWRDWLGKDAEAFPYGSFGENFTVAGLLEAEVYAGDQVRIGEALAEVTKPRVPCATLNKVWERRDFAAHMGREGWTGWYLRVLTPGHVAAGDSWELVSREEGASSMAALWAAKRD